MPDDSALAAIVRQVGAFHITDRAMKAAQARIEAALRGGTVDERSRAAYLSAVRRYFCEFHDEAREHLRDIDRRLEHVNQVHFNLSAERAVAVKRIEATRAVLDALGGLQEQTPS
jgi:hypothetical protein